MLHGMGSDQEWMTKKWEETRKKILLDRTGYSAADLVRYEIEDGQGEGDTNSEIWWIEQHPFPMNTDIRSKKIIDTRKSDPKKGERSD